MGNEQGNADDERDEAPHRGRDPGDQDRRRRWVLAGENLVLEPSSLAQWMAAEAFQLECELS